MNDCFLGKVALVTGGSRGIGKAITLALARLGAAVVVNYLRDEEKARETAAELDTIEAKYMLIRADVRDYVQVKRMMAETEARFGKIHFLINNAGINRDRTLKKMELSEWDEVIATDLTGVFHCCKAALDHMVLDELSRIVIISSIVGEMGNLGQVNYAAAKAGLLGLTKSLARELARYRVTVNAVAPGFTRTEMFDRIPADIQANIIRNIPLGRVATPEEIAHTVVFLCSPLAGFITGSVIDVNGGMYM
jgi:3-oxoacyl-[acyl-carrier protein] reductase